MYTAEAVADKAAGAPDKDRSVIIACLPLKFHPAAIRASALFDLLPIVGPPEGRVFRVFEHAPNLGPVRPGNSGFIFRAAGRDCRAGDEAPSAFCRRSSYADERRYSLYAKPRIFAAPRRD